VKRLVPPSTTTLLEKEQVIMRLLSKSHPHFFQVAVIIIPLALALAPASAQADFEFTASGTSSDGPLAAEAYFTLQNGEITLYVANLTSGVQSQGDAISGIQFTVSAPPDTSLTLQSAAGNVLQLSNGTFTQQGYQTFTASGGVAANWAAQTNNNVTDIGNPSNPHYLIVGPNASFSGGGGTNFNPYFQSTATAATDLATGPQGSSVVFVLSAPGATSGSTISNVVFNFGTSPNEHTANGTGGFVSPPTTAPEPGTLVLALTGTAGLGLFAVLRRRGASRASGTLGRR
jgi:hypothetical protein